MSDERVRQLQLYSIDDKDLLRCSDINVNMYGAEGKRVDHKRKTRMRKQMRWLSYLALG